MAKLSKIALPVLLVVTVIGMIVYVNLYSENDSIFDEIYTNIDKINPPENLKRKDYSNFDDNEKEYHVVQFTYEDKVSSKYKDIFFAKNNRDRSLEICFTKELDRGVKLKMWYIYKIDDKKADEELLVIDNKGGEERYIDKYSRIKTYLKRYHVTSKQIEQSYRLVIRDLVLKDWTKAYNSKYTPSGYNKVKVKKQWEN